MGATRMMRKQKKQIQFNKSVRKAELKHYVKYLNDARNLMLGLSYAATALLTSLALFVNTYFTLFFSYGKSISWLRTTAVTMLLSVTLMSFVKILLVLILPQKFIGLAIIVLSTGFIVVAGTCESIVVNTLGQDSTGICSYVTI